MRLSRDDELEGESASISTQKQILRDYANEQGFLVVNEYVDDGFSGTNFERPSFKRMIEDIEDGKINCVVTKDLSRLGRNYILTGQYTELYFPSKGVRYIAIHDGVDTIREDNDIAPFKNIVNEWQAKETSRKVKNAMKAKFKNGEYIAPVVPIGYKINPAEKNRLVVDEETKWIVEKIFALAAHGYGANKICRTLAAEKVPIPAWWASQKNGYKANIFEGQPEGKKYLWNIVTVSKILQNEIYLGNTVHYQIQKLSYKSKKNVKRPKEDWMRIENTHEPLVDRETWDLVQGISIPANAAERAMSRRYSQGCSNAASAVGACHRQARRTSQGITAARSIPRMGKKRVPCISSPTICSMLLSSDGYNTG